MSNTIQTAANTSTAVTITTGATTAAGSFTGWLEQNAAVIGIGLTICSLIVMIVFNVLNYRINLSREKRDAKLKRFDKIAEMKDKGLTNEQIKESIELAGIDNAE